MAPYDADAEPPSDWWGRPEPERLEAVITYHRGLGGRHAAHREAGVHARLHMAVETQLTAGLGPVVRAFARFSEAGVVRHEIVHAVGTTFAEAMRAALVAGDGDGQAHYERTLDALQPGAWLARAVGPRVARR